MSGQAKRQNAAAQALWLVREQALATLSDALQRRDLTAVLVKGAALALTTYAKPWERDMGDIDLLADDVDAARSALIDAGCREVPLSRPVTAADLGASVFALRIGSLDVPIDLHGRLDKIVSRPVDYDAIFERSAPTDFAALRVPDPVDHALLIVLHAATAEFTHEACWRDLELLFSDDFDHDVFAERARAWCLVTASWMAFERLRVRGVAVPARGLQPSPVRRRLALWAHDSSRVRQLGWRWVLRQAPLRDDTFNWVAGMLRYSGRRILERTLLR